MPRSKNPNKGEDEDEDENVSEPQQKSTFDYFIRRKRRGRPKKHANLVTNKVEARKKHKKQPK